MKRLYLVLLLALPLRAAEPWTLPLLVSDPRAVLAAASRYPLPEGTSAAILDYSVQIQIDDSGKMTKNTRSVARVLRVPGIERARRATVGWILWRQNRPKLRARVITADGRPHVFDEASAIEQTMSAGVNVLSAILPDVNVDSVVEFEIEESDREAMLPGSCSGEVSIGVPFLISHFQLDVMASSTVRVEARGLPEGTRVVSESMDKAQKTHVEASNIPPVRDANLLPPETAAVPTVSFTNVPDWQTVTRWYAGIIDKAGGQAGAPQAAIGDRLRTIEEAFEALRQKVHDNGTPFGTSSLTPQAPAEILQKGSGDSKDAAVLLISKLAEAGISAKAALISSDPKREVIRNLPGIDGFTHMLVYVAGDHPLWIDPSAEFTPVTRLPSIYQGRLALIIDAGTTGLVRTPESTAAENRQLQDIEIQLQDGADARVGITIESRGAFEDLLRPILKSLNGTDTSAREDAQATILRLARVQRITKTDAADPRKLLTPCRLQATAEGYTASQVRDDGGFIELPGPGSVNFDRLITSLQITEQGAATENPSRSSDYYAPPAFTEEATYHVIPPPGYRFKQAPPVSDIGIGPLQLAAKAKLDPDGSLRVNYIVTAPKTRYTIQEVATMRRDAPKLAGKTTLHAVFVNVAEEAVATGDLKEAVALFRQSAAASPLNSSAQLRLAIAYVNAGARRDAMKVCNDVLAKEPNNAAAYARLGWVYTHDEFGRPYSAGMSMSEAEKALLKALELEPNKAYLIQLATLYTYNAQGIRFGNSSRLEDAVRAYRQAGLDSLARSGLINDYALTLLFARKYEDLRQLFFYPEGDRVDPTLKLAAIAAAHGTDDVKGEADYQYPDPGKRRTALIIAARHLLSARDFQPALALLDLAGPGASIPPSELAMLRRARRFDETAASKQPEVAVFQRFISAVLDPPDPAAWKKFVVPELRDRSDAQLRSALLQLSNARPEMARVKSSWPFLTDILTTTADFITDGSSETGFRIRIADPAKKSKPKIAGYIVRRSDDYLVAGLAADILSVAEALSKAQAGNLAAARQWLAWAEDEAPPVPASSDPLAGLAFQKLWPPKSEPSPDFVKIAAASLAVHSTRYKEGIQVLGELRSKMADPGQQALIDRALGEGLLAHHLYSDAIPVYQRLQAKWPDSSIAAYSLAEALINTGDFAAASTQIETLGRKNPSDLAHMRLRERLLVQQRKFKEAAELQSRICATPKASPGDWNDLAWVDLFAGADEKSMLQAATKAVELVQERDPAVVHTLALVQASAGQLKDAIANGYRLSEAPLDADDLLIAFARIAEQLDLRETAGDYYRRIRKPNEDLPVSVYAFAQMRLAQLQSTPLRLIPNSGVRPATTPRP